MIISSPFHESNPRLGVMKVIVGAGLFVLLVALWRMQVTNGAHFDSREQAQSLRRIRIPSARGEIFDRNGVVLANNRPSYDVALYLEQLPRTSKKQDIVLAANNTLAPFRQTWPINTRLTDDAIRNHFARRRPLPLTVWRDLTPELVGAFVERVGNLPGVDLVVTPVRQYPQGKLAAHALGFVGKPEQRVNAEAEDVEDFDYFQPDTVGKQGVERARDEFLHGEPGGMTIRVSPGGSKVGVVGEKRATRGNRITLTLDARMQRIVEDALAHTVLPVGKQLSGAAVVLDPRTGEVLAMASVPTFDPNVFGPGVPGEIKSALFQDPGKPTLNRATGARYAPGSTFKTITLLAGLEAGAIHQQDSVVCSGSMKIGTWPRPFRCWSTQGHGAVDALGAMKHSCDIWFYQEGMATGVDAIANTAREFGLGSPTGLDMANDLSGLVPSPTWKRGQVGENWWDGDTAQMSIGQSFLLVTPLQMANVAATFANGGTLWQPFMIKRIESARDELVEETKPKLRGRLTAKPQNIEFVRQTMLAAVQSPEGTGHNAAVRGLSVAGKTGTAEFDTRGTRIKRTWFIGFAPYDQPQVAVAIVIEDGESGGHTVAPVAGQIMAGIFGKSVDATGGSAGYAD